VALHACGHLSDVALGHAVQNNAGAFVICPCCFLSNPQLRLPTTEEEVHQFLNITSEEWSALKLLAEVQGDFTLSNRAIHTICAVRARAVEREMLLSHNNNSNCSIQIKRFPVRYTTRNICIVGEIIK